MKSQSRKHSGKQTFFDAKIAFKKKKEYGAGATVVSQGEDCSDIHYVETGFVKLTVVSKRGKGAVLGMLGAGDFFGEACIGGDTVYSSTATAVTPTSVWFMPGKIMLRTLRENSTFAMEFISYLLRRDRLIEQDLIDHLLQFSGADRGLIERVDVYIGKDTGETFTQWLARYGLPPDADPKGDPLGKGMTYQQQFIAGTARVDPKPGACDNCGVTALCRIQELRSDC